MRKKWNSPKKPFFHLHGMEVNNIIFLSCAYTLLQLKVNFFQLNAETCYVLWSNADTFIGKTLFFPLLKKPSSQVYVMRCFERFFFIFITSHSKKKKQQQDSINKWIRKCTSKLVFGCCYCSHSMGRGRRKSRKIFIEKQRWKLVECYLYFYHRHRCCHHTAIYNNKKSTMRYETILPWDDTSLFQALIPYSLTHSLLSFFLFSAVFLWTEKEASQSR